MTPVLIAAGLLLLALAYVALVRRSARHVTLAGLALALAALLLPLAPAPALFTADVLGLLIGGVVLLVAWCVVLASRETGIAYYASILLASVGMLLAATAANLIMLFIAIELVTTPFYALVTWGKSRQRLEAGMKYFVVALVASALLLLGIVLLSSGGSTRIADLRLVGTLPLVGIAAVIAGLGFKLGVWPFGFWIPDVYQGAPSPIAGFLAGASKKVAFVALIRIGVVLAVPRWGVIMAAIAALTMTVPNLIALVQRDARRMLAYSIVTHAGYLLMGLVILSPITVSGTVFHMVTHAFMALGAFLVLGVFAQHGLERIDQLNGLGWKNPFLGGALTIFLLSLAGILFLSGFASKFYLFFGVASVGLVWLAVLAIVNSVISLYYYFRIIRALYGYKTPGRALEVPYGTLVAIMVCLFITVFIGFYPVPVIDAVVAAAKGLF